jgi:shikimate kinase
MNPEAMIAPNIFLIGYRCSGKSSVGSSLAVRLGWPLIDTDSLLVAESQTSIKEIVDSHGWEAFRKLEHDVVKRVCSRRRQVVATGGGAVLDEKNVGRMKASGKLVWLKAAPETIKTRMAQDQNSAAFRPALTSQDSVSEIEETLCERESYYRNAMDFAVDTEDKQIDEICDTIVRQLLESGYNLLIRP